MLAFTGGLGGLWLWDEHRAGSVTLGASGCEAANRCRTGNFIARRPMVDPSSLISQPPNPRPTARASPPDTDRNSFERRTSGAIVVRSIRRPCSRRLRQQAHSITCKVVALPPSTNSASLRQSLNPAVTERRRGRSVG